VLSIVVFIIWISLAYSGLVDLQGSQPFPFALSFAITVLVISCPCAFSLAVPSAVMVATGVGARLGVLFKEGQVIEDLFRADSVVFDKTGTLTTGKMEVTHVECFLQTGSGSQSRPNQILLFLAGSAEMNSEHVIAKSISQYASLHCGRPLVQPTDFVNMIGRGVSCSVEGVSLLVGNIQHVEDFGVEIGPQIRFQISEEEQRGRTVVLVAANKVIQGMICLEDHVRPEAASVIYQLKIFGLQVSMITGDNAHSARRVAEAVGIPLENTHSRFSPEQKVKFVEQLNIQGRKVVMVGDGVNDSAALLISSVGVSFKGSTEIAVQAADLILLAANLNSLLLAMDLSRVTMSRIRLNFAWAIGYNVLAIPLASGMLSTFGAVIPPALAGISEIASSLPVLVFSLLLYSFKPQIHRV